VKLLWRRQGRAGQLGHKLQTGDDGHKNPPCSHSHLLRGIYLSIITPKFNIPSSFDVQLGRVSFVGEKDFVLVHALHAVQCAGQGPIWRWSFLQQVCVCGFGGEQ
jgi:hypothetical protein